MTSPEPHPAWRSTQGRTPWTLPRIALTATALLLAAWLLSPMFTSTYIEAYMERLQSMAMLQPHGLLWHDDQSYPINTEFLYATRVGMVELMRACIALFGSTSLWGLRILTIASFATLSYACLAFARRWSADSGPSQPQGPPKQQEPWWALAAILILTPGIVEPSFFFADNLISAAFATLALALVTARVTAPRWLAIGALFAAAMLVRLDALLVAPMILTVLWFACRDYRKIALALVLSVASASAVFLVNWKFTGISLLQAIQVGRFFSAVNATDLYGSGHKRTIIITLGFFGLVTLLCLAVGLWSNLKRHSIRWSLVMTLVPVVFYLVVIPKANEIRDFCLLAAPYVVLHGGTGLRLLVQSAAPRRSLPRTLRLPVWLARLALLACACVLVAPAYLLTKDGPRPVLGRLWSPIFWHQWQAIRKNTFAQLDQILQSTRPGDRTLVISSNFDPDRTLHLELLQAGYEILPIATEGDCQSLETLRKGDATLTILRTESPYGMIAAGNLDKKVAALQVTSSLACLRGKNFNRKYFLAWGSDFGWTRASQSETDVPARSFPVKVLHRSQFPSLTVSTVDPDTLLRLQAAAFQVLADPKIGAGYQLLTYQQFRHEMRNRYFRP